MGASGLGALLVKEGLLTEQDRRTITKTCGQSSWAFAKSVLAMGMIDEDELAAFFADKTRYHVAPRDLLETIDPNILDKVDARMVAQLEVLPIKVDWEMIQVAVADPLDKGNLRQLEFFTGLEVDPIIAPLSQIYTGLKRLIPEFRPQLTALSAFLDNHASTAWQRQRLDRDEGHDTSAIASMREANLPADDVGDDDVLNVDQQLGDLYQEDLSDEDLTTELDSADDEPPAPQPADSVSDEFHDVDLDAADDDLELAAHEHHDEDLDVLDDFAELGGTPDELSADQSANDEAVVDNPVLDQLDFDDDEDEVAVDPAQGFGDQDEPSTSTDDSLNEADLADFEIDPDDSTDVPESELPPQTEAESSTSNPEPAAASASVTNDLAGLEQENNDIWEDPWDQEPPNELATATPEASDEVNPHAETDPDKDSEPKPDTDDFNIDLNDDLPEAAPEDEGDFGEPDIQPTQDPTAGAEPKDDSELAALDSLFQEDNSWDAPRVDPQPEAPTPPKSDEPQVSAEPSNDDPLLDDLTADLDELDDLEEPNLDITTDTPTAESPDDEPTSGSDLMSDDATSWFTDDEPTDPTGDMGDAPTAKEITADPMVASDFHNAPVGEETPAAPPQTDSADHTATTSPTSASQTSTNLRGQAAQDIATINQCLVRLSLAQAEDKALAIAENALTALSATGMLLIFVEGKPFLKKAWSGNQQIDPDSIPAEIRAQLKTMLAQAPSDITAPGWQTLEATAGVDDWFSGTDSFTHAFTDQADRQVVFLGERQDKRYQHSDFIESAEAFLQQLGKRMGK